MNLLRDSIAEDFTTTEDDCFEQPEETTRTFVNQTWGRPTDCQALADPLLDVNFNSAEK